MYHEIGVAEGVPGNFLGLWRSENEVCCCDEGYFMVKCGGGDINTMICILRVENRR